MSNLKVPSSQGGREGENPDAASPISEKSPPTPALIRNSSGNASHAASLLDLRQHVNAIEEVLESLARQGLITDEGILPLRRLRQRGFRRTRG